MNSKITFLFLFFVSIYFLTGQGSIQSSDGKIMYLLTQSMVENQSLSFSESVTIAETQGPQYSKYGLGMSVLAVPFYIFGKVLSALLGIEESMATQFTVSMINAILTAFSCVMIYRFALDRLSFRSSTGLFLAAGFGLSTIAWYYSEDFMSEPATTLFLLSAVYFATNPDQKRKNRSLLLAGVFLACAVSCRLATLLAVPGFIFYHWMMWKNEQKFVELWVDIFRAAIPVSFVLIIIMAYNYVRFDDLFESGYEKGGFGGRFLVGFYGILFSPGKSLFLYNPLTIFGCLAFTRFLAGNKKIALFFVWLILSHLLMFSFWHSWSGGMGWGPRLMLVVMPYLILPVGYLWEAFAKEIKIPLIAALVLGIVVQIPSITVNISRYYYEMSQQFGSAGHDKLLFSLKQSPLIGQFKQVAVVYENLNDDLQIAQMVSLAKKKKKFLGADIKVVLDNGLAVNVPNFWWYYMRLFGYPFYLWLLPSILFAGVAVVSAYKLVQATRNETI
jgi:hypothetical protein